MSYEYQHVTFEVEDGIAVLTLNRPDARNALSPEMRIDFHHAFADVKVRAGGDIKALIITGAGKGFCAGGDVKTMTARAKTAVDGRKGLRDSHENMLNLMNLELPVISLVRGAAAGAGANIALAADFVLATPSAFFMQAFMRIGLVPDWSGFFILPRLVGLQKAKELIYTARRVYAEEAKQMGMVYDIVPEDGALEAARTFAKRFLDAPTSSIGMAKNILLQSFNQDHRTLLEMEAAVQAIARTTEFHDEATKRFANKQPALFDWEAMDRKQAAE